MKISSWLAAYAALAFLTLAIYWQGLNSLFLLDDAPNLSTMGDHLSLGYWNNLFIFLLEGHSGPTGRPLSLLSFYLNSSSYDNADPWVFKLTNVFIHIINGALLSGVLHKLTLLINIDKKRAKCLIILTVAFWLLHPFQVTTVLYIIQRMTELSALFILSGVLVYLYGRECLNNATKTTLVKRSIFLSSGIWLFLLLAMLSKETGIMLLGYILVIEYFLLRPLNVNTTHTVKKWIFITIFIPFISILVYLYWGGLAPHAYDSRPFTLEQRLLTETRIIFDYIANILIPGFSTPSLFHDDYLLSSSWTTPWTTLTSAIGLIILITMALILRAKYALLSFGIAWFFVSHLIESTVIPLELYFEHRNYLAMLGPLLIIIYYIQQLSISRPRFKKVSYLFIGVFSLMIIANTVQNTALWSKPLVLITTWVKDHPNSVRAVETLDSFEKMANATFMDKDIRKILQDLQKNEDSPYFLSLRQLMISCNKGMLNSIELQKIQNKLSHRNNELGSAQPLHGFIKEWTAGKCKKVSPDNMISFLDSLLNSPRANIGTLKHVAYFGLSEAWKTKRNLDEAIFYLTKSYQRKPSLGMLLRKANFFISAGLYDEANTTLDDLSLLQTTFRKRLVIKLRQQEIDSVRENIQQHIQLSKQLE